MKLDHRSLENEQMGISDEIETKHILLALNELDMGHKVPPNCESREYDLLFQGKRYPPKYVVRLAHSFIRPSGEMLSPYKGAKATRAFLNRRGFEIVPKSYP
jgi:5-methylcytosine-specific restriction protein B